MWSNWLLDYLVTHPNTKIQYWQSDMRLIIHSDASFLVEWDAKSNYGGYFYLGCNQNDDEPQQINGAVDVSASLLPLVAISVAEQNLEERFIMQKRARYYSRRIFHLHIKRPDVTMVGRHEIFCEIICHIFESQCPFYSVSVQIYLIY